jgi:hypothetical protein
VIFYFLCSLLTRVMPPHSSTLCFQSIRIQDMNNLTYGGSSMELLGGYPKIRIRSPSTGEKYTQKFKSEAQMMQEETKNPLNTAHASESCYTCPRAPFTGRRRDFYIPKMLSNLQNISSVNMYMKVFYIP